jgi:hypothetical protein
VKQDRSWTEATGSNQTPEGLWTQKQAAAFLNVSPRYLRDTGCPRVELVGNGEKGRPVVRYSPAAVATWSESRWQR